MRCAAVGLLLLAAVNAAAAPAPHPNIRQLVAGNGYSCVVLEGGVGKCWGTDMVAEAYVGQTAPGKVILHTLDFGGKIRQLALGSDFQCALLETGVVKCVGQNDFGQLGLGARRPQGEVRFGATKPGGLLKPVKLGVGIKAKQIVAGAFHACALLTDGTVKCWGDNASGVIRRFTKDEIAAYAAAQDDRDNEPYSEAVGTVPGDMGEKLPRIALSKKATALSSGAHHVCAILTDRSIECWGNGDSGTLGNGDSGIPFFEGKSLSTVDFGAPSDTMLDLQTGDDLNCVLIRGGEVRCWGYGADGALGNESQTSIGFEPNQMGRALVPVRIEPGIPVTSIAASNSSNFVCATLLTGAVKCWGPNDKGQLGIGDTTIRGTTQGSMGEDLPSVDLGPSAHAIQVVTGFNHACALLLGNQIKCWGNNSVGQLGNADRLNRGDKPRTMGTALTEVEYWK